MWSEKMMGFDGHLANINSTFFHSGQLYWIIILQSNINFFIHSLNISTSHNLTEGYCSSFLSVDRNTNEFISEFDMPIVDDLSQICLEDINQEYNSRAFYCPQTMPGSWHKLVIFHSDYLQTNVSRDLSSSFVQFIGDIEKQAYMKHSCNVHQ